MSIISAFKREAILNLSNSLKSLKYLLFSQVFDMKSISWPHYNIVCIATTSQNSLVKLIFVDAVLQMLLQAMDQKLKKHNHYKSRLVRIAIMELSCCIKGTKESTLRKDFSVCLMHHEPSDIGLIFLVIKKCKIRSYLGFPRESLLSYYVSGPAFVSCLYFLVCQAIL